MTRITTTILVFMLLLNGTVTVVSGSGLDDDVGVELAPGVSDAMDDVISNMKRGFSPNIGVVQSLISLFIAAANVFRVVVEGLYAAPVMFQNFGFPSWIVLPFFAPLYLISTLELIYIVTGRITV